jgi:hypothetical protein
MGWIAGARCEQHWDDKGNDNDSTSTNANANDSTNTNANANDSANTNARAHNNR